MNRDLPLDRILPSCGNHVLLILTLSVLHSLDVNRCLPPGQQGGLFLLIIGVKEDEFIGVKQDGVLEGIPSILLESPIITRNHLVVIGVVGLLLPVEAVFPQVAYPHLYIVV